MFQKIFNTPFVYLPQKMWHYAKGKRHILLLFILMFTIANLLVLAEPLLVGYIMGEIQQHGIRKENLTSLLMLLFFIVIFDFGTWIFHGPARVLEMNLAFWIRATYKQYLLDGVLRFPLQWHAEHHSGDTIDKINKGSEALYNFAHSTFLLIELVVRSIGACVILAYFHGPSLAIVGISIIITFLTTQFFDKKIVASETELNHFSNKISAKVFDVISNITTIIVLRAEKVISKVFWSSLLSPKKTFFHFTVVNESKWFMTSMYVSMTVYIVIASYIWQQTILGQVLLVGNIYILFQYVGKISEMFFRITYMYGDLIHQRAAVKNAEELAEAFAHQEIVAQEPMDNWQTITVKDLSFHYGTPDQEAQLSIPEFHIKKGERIAFVGKSGSGKTTFLKLLRGLYPLTSGTVTLDDKILPDGFMNISSHIGLLPQDPELFNTTIEENITFGMPHAHEEIRHMTTIAAFTDIAERLPHGFDSEIQEKGVNLSGGEKQRLAISRGLLASKDGEILLLDEPTSSIDGANELTIYHGIFEEFKDKTIISSIHRLHLLSLFDRVVFFAHGKVIASGSVEEVKATSEEFRNLWERYHETTKMKELLL